MTDTNLIAPEKRLKYFYIFLQAYTLYVKTDIYLRLFGFGKCAQSLVKQHVITNPRNENQMVSEVDLVDRISEIGKQAARIYVRRVKCLERSLVICSLLRKYRFPAELCIGYTKFPPLVFHAWVECYGKVVNDSVDLRDRYSVISVC